jgi:hypothetical protein
VISLDASWGDRTLDPVHGTVEVQADGCICVIEFDERLCFALTMCGRLVWICVFRLKVEFSHQVHQFLNFSYVVVILTK